MRRRLLIVLAVLAIAVALGATAATLLGDDEPQTAKRSDASFPVTDSKRSATIWAVGDGADGDARAKQVAELIERGRPDRVLYLGDVYERGTREEFADNYRTTFGRFGAITAPTPGNHDWPRHEEGYDPYWKQANPRLPQNRHWYRFVIAGWEFLSLNSEEDHDPGSPQVRWLRRQVREPGTCRIAFWHRPFQSAGRHGDQEQVEPLWQAVSGHAAIVIGGNDHDMQRFERRDGLVQFVSGAGGRELYEVDRSDPRLAFGEGDEYGALRLDLRPGAARYRFVAVDGRTLDSGTIPCRPLSDE
jgi:3',5'-cyclic AMP phosphodiesterase CpdA